MKKYDDFYEWWKDYSRISSLNKIHLSFLDVDVLQDELKLAFNRKLPKEISKNNIEKGE